MLSFEVGAVKPDAAIFEAALTRLGVDAAHAVMVGDSEEADGGARAVGCGFILVDPLPTVRAHRRAAKCASRLRCAGMTGPDRIRTPWWLKHANKVLVVLLRLGVPVSRRESPVVLTVPGRKTGKPRSTPITPMHIDGKRYVVNGYPGADWVDNVRAAERVTVTQGRRTEQVRMVELSPEDARPVLRAFPALVSTGVDIMKRAGVLTTGTADELEGLAGRLPVFRIDPVT